MQNKNGASPIGALSIPSGSGTHPISPEAVAIKKRELVLDDPSSIQRFGDEVQLEITRLNRDILERTQASELGAEVDALISQVALKVKGIDPKDLDGGSLLDRVFGRARGRLERFKASFQSVEMQVSAIAAELVRHAVKLDEDILTHRRLQDLNYQRYRDLSVFIEAGRQRLQEAREIDLPQARRFAEAAASNEFETHRVQALEAAVARLDQKVLDLEARRTSSVLTACTLHMLQELDLTAVENIRNTVNVALPEWRQGFTIALGLNRLQRASEASAAVRQVTNTLMRQNADLLAQTASKVSADAEKPVIDIETLQHVHAKILTALNAVQEVREKGRMDREGGRAALLEIEQDRADRIRALTVST